MKNVIILFFLITSTCLAAPEYLILRLAADGTILEQAYGANNPSLVDPPSTGESVVVVPYVDLSDHPMWKDVSLATKRAAEERGIPVLQFKDGKLWTRPAASIQADIQALIATPAYKRGEQYRLKTDSLLLAIVGYNIEIDAETNPTKKAALQVKRDKAQRDYLKAKKKIRDEIPD